MRSVGFVGPIIITFISHQLLNQVSLDSILLLLRSHDSSFESQSQAHGDAIVEGFIERLRERLVVKFGEEAERAQSK